MYHRCEFIVDTRKPCNKRVMLGLSECKYCSRHYCSVHYMLELHKCPQMTKIKEDQRQLLRDKLMTGKATFSKLTRV